MGPPRQVEYSTVAICLAREYLRCFSLRAENLQQTQANQMGSPKQVSQLSNLRELSR